MDQTDLDDPANNLRTSKLIQTIEGFLLKIAERADEVHAREVKNGDTLDGKKIRQTPERFLEEHFVKECIEILGYTDYRPQPKGFDGLGEKIPDFELVDTRYLVIGEIKKPNWIDDGRRECKKYLSQISEPAAGIATDGFMWQLYFTEGNGGVEEKTLVNIGQSVNRLALEHLYNKGARRDRRILREKLYELVDCFEKTQLETQIERFLTSE